MTLADLIFIGLKRRVAALDRRTGEIVWQWKASSGNNYTSLLLDRDLLVVSVDGYTYGLQALSGEQLWFNELPGFGVGVASLVSVNGSSSAQHLAKAAAATAAAAAASQSSHAGQQ